MTGRLLPAGLLAVVRDGIRARTMLSAGILALTTLAVASAVLGPAFSVGVTNSFVVTRLIDAPDRLTGLSWEFRPTPGGPGGPEAVASALADGAAAAEAARPRTHLPATLQVETERIEVPGIWTDPAAHEPPEIGVEVRLLTAERSCERLVVTGRCPSGPGEVLMLAADAETDGLSLGDVVDLGRPLGRLALVGTYLAPDGEEAASDWFDPSRFQSFAMRELPGTVVPRRPAPYVTVPETLGRVGQGRLVVRADSRLHVPPDLTVADFGDLVAAAERATRSDGVPVEVPGGTLSEVSLNDLPALAPEIAAEQEVAAGSIAPAVLSLVLVALALLGRLIAAAADLRTQELALASLRGVGARRAWVLGLAEPFALLVLAVPLGLAAGVASTWTLVRLWLVPGLPVPLPWQSWVAALAVVLTVAVVAVLSTAGALRRDLASMLAGVRRPSRPTRAVMLGALTLVALAVVLPVAALTGSRSAPDPTDLVLPVLLGVVAGLGAVRLVGWAARRGQGRARGSIAGYVAVRALARRREATLVVIPLAVAVAVSVFGAGVHGASAAWRHSVAATEAPAAAVYRTDLTMTEATDLTHELDPEGRWLMAAASFSFGAVPWTVVDSPRLAAVATWPAQWTEVSAGDLAQRLGTGEVATITGTTVDLTVEAGGGEVPAEGVTAELLLRPLNGTTRGIYLGPFGAGATTRTAAIPCEAGCRVIGLDLGGAATSPTDLAPEYVLGPLVVDGTPATGVLASGGWAPTPVADGLQSARAVEVEGDRLRVLVDVTDDVELVRLTSLDIPPRRPVLAGREAVADLNELPSGARSVSWLPPAAEAVAISESVPFLGPRGVMADFTMTTHAHPLSETGWEVHVLAGADLPPEVARGLAAHGLTVSTTLEGVGERLDETAYAQAMRLYAVTAAVVMLMALAGLAISTAVQLPSRRSDAASLRVIGVRRQSVLTATVQETLAVLGTAAVAGALAGVVAQLVVLRTLTLGSITEVASPRLIAELDAGQLAAFTGGAVLVLAVVAATSAALTVRGAHGGTLREKGR